MPGTVDPQLFWEMIAPLLQLHTIASAPEPCFCPSKIWQDIIFTPDSFFLAFPPAIPQTPRPLLLTAAMVPATWVPWSPGLMEYEPVAKL